MRTQLFLTYFAGAVVSIIGVSNGLIRQVKSTKGPDRIICLGPLFLAVPMAVFGMQHFVFSDSVATLVPSWVPAHLFWVFLVGACLIGGALSLAVRKYSGLAAALFGVMLLFFEMMLHIPKIVAAPSDRFAWAVALRDLAFSWGALSFAVTQTEKGEDSRRLLLIARFFIGIPIAFFGVEQFLHPEFRPGVPLRQFTPTWIPGHLLFAQVTGLVFAVLGLSLLSGKQTRLIATWLGLTILLVVLVINVPILISEPSSIGDGLNSLVDTLLLGGSVLCFAGAQGKRSLSEPTEVQVALGAS